MAVFFQDRNDDFLDFVQSFMLSVLQIGPSNQAADASAASFAQYMNPERHSVRCRAGHDVLCAKS
jgi:hypothetical protein